MYDITQFREVIKQALQAISAYSAEAEEILVATCAHESKGGTYVMQVSGPAVGAYQMEPRTHDDLWSRELRAHQDRAITLLKACGYRARPAATTMSTNLLYATLMARVFYMQFREALPKSDDLDAIWEYYKKYWNTELGSAKKEDFLKNYYAFTGAKKSAPKRIDALQGAI